MLSTMRTGAATRIMTHDGRQAFNAPRQLGIRTEAVQTWGCSSLQQAPGL